MIEEDVLMSVSSFDMSKYLHHTHAYIYTYHSHTHTHKNTDHLKEIE